jgi:hypothetical protein
MPLILKSVAPRRGAQWVREGLVLFARKPLAFTSLFVLFLVFALCVALMPFVGGMLQLALMPLASLGFMLAAQSALLGGDVRPRHFMEPLLAEQPQPRTLIVMCVVYGMAAFAMLSYCDWLSDQALLRMQKLLAKPGTTQAQLLAILDEPGVTQAAMAFAVLGTVLTVPFWHAPALVHWGRQGLGHALFSSTLAMWRNKGAFSVYTLVWVALGMGLVTGVLLLLALLGLARFSSMLAMPMALALSAAFYVSLLFTFNDCFGSATSTPAEGEGGAPAELTRSA